MHTTSAARTSHARNQIKVTSGAIAGYDYATRKRQVASEVFDLKESLAAFRNLAFRGVFRFVGGEELLCRQRFFLSGPQCPTTGRPRRFSSLKISPIAGG